MFDVALFAKIFGFAGIASTVVIYQQKTRKGLLLSKLISDVLWFLHYFCLGAYSGAGIAVIGLVRELIFMNREKKWAKHWAWLVFFLVLSVVSALVTWKGWASLLPMVASMLAVIGFWIGKPRISRLMSFPIAGSMLIYDVGLNPMSVAGIINELLAIGSSVVGIIRYDRPKKEEIK